MNHSPTSIDLLNTAKKGPSHRYGFKNPLEAPTITIENMDIALQGSSSIAKDVPDYPKGDYDAILRPKKGSHVSMSQNHIRFNSNFVGFKLAKPQRRNVRVPVDKQACSQSLLTTFAGRTETSQDSETRRTMDQMKLNRDRGNASLQGSLDSIERADK